MQLNRRDLLGALTAAPLLGTHSASSFSEIVSRENISAPTLPDKTSFPFAGTHLNGAFAHPVAVHCRKAAADFFSTRSSDVNRLWPVNNPRQVAVDSFAALINAAPGDIAVVPSTLVGENLLAAALGLGRHRGVLTDPFHYDASLAMYGERHKQGMPLVVLQNRNNVIDYDELRHALTPEIKLVAVSWVSSWTGFRHDLSTICQIAHEKGALVYADIIQGVGAIPFDVQETGVDFCCAGTYKWLMGDFGTAFLYVRPDRLSELRRVEIGWRALTSATSHFLPFDSPGPTALDWILGSDVATTFEVGTPNWCALQVATASIGYIKSVGVSKINRYREPMLDLLQTELPRAGFQALTPKEYQGPFVAFAFEGARERFAQRLAAAQTYITLGKNRIRISASVYNDQQEIESLIELLRS